LYSSENEYITTHLGYNRPEYTDQIYLTSKYSPMKKIIILLVIFGTAVSTAFCQIKEQYQDTASKKTTVVIKEDGVNDLDLLNSHFNLDDYSVNDQIRITTDQVAMLNAKSVAEVPSEPENVTTPVLNTNTTSTVNEGFQRPKTNMKRWSVREKKQPVNTAATPEETTTVAAAPETIASTTKATPSRISKRNTRSKSSTVKSKRKAKKVKRKKRTRRVKNKKRKKRNRKNLGCYKF